MAKQAELQRLSIDLQERQMRQWVEYGKWWTGLELTNGILQDGNATTTHIFGVKLEVNNPTHFPITLPHASITFSIPEGPVGTFVFRRDCILLPNSPLEVSIGMLTVEVQVR